MTRSIPTGNEGADVNVEGDLTVDIATLPVSQTKERGRGRSNLQSEVTGGAIRTSTYKCKRTIDGEEVIGSRNCGICGLNGHYLTTCPRNPNRSRVVEKKGTSRGGARKRGRPRTRRGSPEMSHDSMDEQDLLDDVDEEYNESDRLLSSGVTSCWLLLCNHVVLVTDQNFCLCIMKYVVAVAFICCSLESDALTK
jgi:hypothetical protein